MGTSRQSWSERQGRGPKAGVLPFERLRYFVFAVFDQFVDGDYLAEDFGQWCGDADNDWIPGREGSDPAVALLLETGRDSLWPHKENSRRFDDVDVLYDVVEFMHHHISKPVSGAGHSFYNHTHWASFDRSAGQEEFRDKVNGFLALADPPVVLDAEGAIHLLPDDGYEQLVAAELPSSTPALVRSRVNAAIGDFRAARSAENLRHAVRDLADALEAVRAEAKLTLHKDDERILFETFNKFGIRHLKPGERIDYESGPFLRWLFYVSLATIHLVLRMRETRNEDPQA